MLVNGPEQTDERGRRANQAKHTICRSTCSISRPTVICITRSMRCCRPPRSRSEMSKPFEAERRHSRIAATKIEAIGSAGRLLMRSNSSSSQPPDQNDSSNCPARPFSRFSRIAFSKMIAQLQNEARRRESQHHQFHDDVGLHEEGARRKSLNEEKEAYCCLFMQADIVVKLVMLILLLASFWSWAIIFEKAMRLKRLNGRAGQFEEWFWSGGSLEELFDRISSRPTDPMASIFVAAMREWRRSASKGLLISDQLRAGLQQRIDRVMQITVGREMEQVERQMVFLASVGAAAPFIGLFGTVWGIIEQLRFDRCVEEHQPCRGGARNRRSVVRDGPGIGRRHPGGSRL